MWRCVISRMHHPLVLNKEDIFHCIVHQPTGACYCFMRTLSCSCCRTALAQYWQTESSITSTQVYLFQCQSVFALGSVEQGSKLCSRCTLTYGLGRQCAQSRHCVQMYRDRPVTHATSFPVAAAGVLSYSVYLVWSLLPGPQALDSTRSPEGQQAASTEVM